MISETKDIEKVRPLFERYMWHMKQYVDVKDEYAWLDGAKTYFELYKTDPTRKIYTVTVNAEIIGFALINRMYRFNSEGNVVAQFYIVAEAQRGGHGRALAKYVFAQQSGAWEVSVYEENRAAYRFWEKVISGCAKDSYAIQRKESFNGCGFTFISA